ncbi:MAG: 2-dehydro-3-deoxygalactonokinase [Roseovarius sp.]|uniref:2-dehydro-3-deoxygalactonokinase n=1 Tax=Roseovarius sp. TaxID=1486281 RepID=UPI0032EAE8B9
MTDWAIVGHDGHRARAFLLRGGRVVDSADGPDREAALAALSARPDRVFHIGEGAPDSLPAAVLPGNPARGLPGLTQDSPADVLDGWVRLLLLGFAEARPDWDGVALVLTEQLSHWVHLSAREAVSCQSFLTPRLIAALGGTLPADTGALGDSLSRPERLATHLRSAEVTGRADAISGFLIGAELAAARPYWLGQSVALIDGGGCGSGHAAALEAQGVPVSRHDPEVILSEALAALGERIG